MKANKIFIPFFMIAILVAAIVYAGCCQTSSSSDGERGLLSENVEALTQMENGGVKFQCTTSILYTGGYSMPMYCPTCSFRYGYVATGGTSQCQ